MLKPYLSILRIKGAAAFTSAGLVARFPIAMYSLGIILLIQIRTDSYFQAGLVVAAFVVAAAICQPVTARWADRLGQDRVLPVQTALHVAALGLGLGSIVLSWPVYLQMLVFAVSGATAPPIGALVRSRWVFVTRTPRQLHTALALESIADEVIFVVGPVVATVLVLNVSDVMGLVVAGVLVSLGVLLLVPQRATQPPAIKRPATKDQPLLKMPPFVWVLIVSVMTGGVFGAFEVSAVAFAEEKGFPESTALLIASYSAGSLIAGLVVGALHLRSWLVARYAIFVAIFAALAIPLPFIHDIYLMTVAVFLAGFSIAPVLITSYAVIERLVEDRRLTEGFTWFTSGLGVGLAAAAAIAGALIDDYGASSGYVLLVACGAGAAISIGLGFRSLARALPRVSDTPAPTVT
ncbi:MAG: MFS transporter [Actinobacteria bacterium]|nr:MFS transporter [Actinomycetota bacterium]